MTSIRQAACEFREQIHLGVVIRGRVERTAYQQRLPPPFLREYHAALPGENRAGLVHKCVDGSQGETKNDR